MLEQPTMNRVRAGAPSSLAVLEARGAELICREATVKLWAVARSWRPVVARG